MEFQGKKVSPDGEDSSESLSDDQYNTTRLMNRNTQRFPMFRKQYTLKKPVEEKD